MDEYIFRFRLNFSLGYLAEIAKARLSGGCRRCDKPDFKATSFQLVLILTFVPAEYQSHSVTYTPTISSNDSVSHTGYLPRPYCTSRKLFVRESPPVINLLTWSRLLNTQGRLLSSSTFWAPSSSSSSTNELQASLSPFQFP
nr:unnamed protein product [Spirometra erinaceieuropaei]